MKHSTLDAHLAGTSHRAVPSNSSHLGRSAGNYPLFLFPATQPWDPQVHCFLTILGKKGTPLIPTPTPFVIIIICFSVLISENPRTSGLKGILKNIWSNSLFLVQTGAQGGE